MEINDLLNGIAEAIGNAVAEKMGVAFQAETHRGICAGSVQYRFQPRGEEADEAAVMKLVDAAYRDLGLELDFGTAKGCTTFFLILTEACKALVQRGKRVNLAGRLVYEAQAYQDGRDAWMKPIAVNREFNRLSAPVELDKTLKLIDRKKKAARKSPFDKVLDGEKQPQATYIQCPECGARIKIAES